MFACLSTFIWSPSFTLVLSAWRDRGARYKQLCHCNQSDPSSKKHYICLKSLKDMMSSCFHDFIHVVFLSITCTCAVEYPWHTSLRVYYTGTHITVVLCGNVEFSAWSAVGAHARNLWCAIQTQRERSYRNRIINIYMYIYTFIYICLYSSKYWLLLRDIIVFALLLPNYVHILQSNAILQLHSGDPSLSISMDYTMYTKNSVHCVVCYLQTCSLTMFCVIAFFIHVL